MLENKKYFKEVFQLDKNFTDSILNNVGMFITVWDTNCNLIKFNKYSEEKTGFREEEVLGTNWTKTFPDENSVLKFSKLFESIQKENIHKANEGKVKCKDGRELYAVWNNFVLSDRNGDSKAIISMGIDITEQKETERKLTSSYQELEAVYEELAATEEELREKYDELRAKEQELEISEERHKLALEGSRDAIWEWDIKRDKTFISERWGEMLGYEPGDLTVNHLIWKNLIHPDDKERAFQAQQDHLKGKTTFYSNEYRLKMKNGEYKWILARGRAQFDADGKPIRIAGSQTDISERKNFEDKINFMAYYDPLTGLPNRVLFEKLLEESISESTINNLRGAVMFLDLDNFKTVNDTFGHLMGDELLKNVAGILRAFEAENIKISRFGGDEFVIIVRDIKNDDDVTDLASHIVQALNRHWHIKGREFYITASVGIVYYPGDGCDVQSALSNADCAMYSVKKTGKDNYRVYSYNMNSSLVDQINMENNLRHAIERNEFIIHYQPQIDQKTTEIVGVEALIRWNSPTTGMVSPSDFIPIAEETGLILPIGEWVLREACRQNKMWQDMGYHKFSVSVNLSARQLKQPDLIHKIRQILEDTGLKAKWLELEITESATISNIDFAVKVLKDLKEIGVSIALDDFGTGYSSLSYLRRLPINAVKIDKSFVDEICEDENAAAITEAIIVMAHKMGIKVVAEGVETWSQHEFLLEEECDLSQGYLFSRPLPAEGIEKLIKVRNPLADIIKK